MADITIENDCGTSQKGGVVSRNLVFISSTVGYAFYIEGTSESTEYRKTTNGGASWGSPVSLNDVAGTLEWITIWYDKWTPSDTGTKIHIWWFETTNDDVLHRTLDTSGDSLSSPVVVFNGASASSTPTAQWLNGTKAKTNGYLYVFFDIDGGTETGFYRSTDGGANWTSRASPFEATADYILLFPSNLADPNDIWGLYDDVSTNEVTLKSYDNSGDSWSESAVITTLVESTQVNTRIQMNGSIRLSDGHLIFVACNNYNNAANDIECWDITSTGGVGSKTQLTNVVTNVADCNGACIFIDQNTNDLYVAYLGNEDGTEAWTTDTKAYYKKSTDDGSTWGSQTALGVTGDDLRTICVDLGGTNTRFYPGWYNDDLFDFVGNFDNSVAISAGTFVTIGPAIATAVANALGESLNKGIGPASAPATAVAMSESLNKALGIALAPAVANALTVGLGFSVEIGPAIAISAVNPLAESLSKGIGPALSTVAINALGESLAKTIGPASAIAAVIPLSEALIKSIGPATAVAIANSLIASLSFNQYPVGHGSALASSLLNIGGAKASIVQHGGTHYLVIHIGEAEPSIAAIGRSSQDTTPPGQGKRTPL